MKQYPIPGLYVCVQQYVCCVWVARLRCQNFLNTLLVSSVHSNWRFRQMLLRSRMFGLRTSFAPCFEREPAQRKRSHNNDEKIAQRECCHRCELDTHLGPNKVVVAGIDVRSEERRVGNECRT